MARVNDTIRQAAERLNKRGFQTHLSVADAGETKLLLRRHRIEVRIEVNFVMCGTVQRDALSLAHAHRSVTCWLADLEIPVAGVLLRKQGLARRTEMPTPELHSKSAGLWQASERPWEWPSCCAN